MSVSFDSISDFFMRWQNETKINGITLILKSHNLRPFFLIRMNFHATQAKRKKNIALAPWLRHNWSWKTRSPTPISKINKTVYWTPDSLAAHYVYLNKCHFMSHHINWLRQYSPIHFIIKTKTVFAFIPLPAAWPITLTDSQTAIKFSSADF